MQLSFKSKAAALGLAGAIAFTSIAGVALAEGGRPGGGQRHAAAVSLRNIVEESGLDASVFKEGAQAGMSIDDILTANGLDPDAIEAALLAELDAKLDEKVAAGDLTEEKAAAVAERAATALDKLMAATPDPERRDNRRDALKARIGKGVVDVAAQAIGITPEELAAELKEGDTTIAEVATENGVDPQDVIDAMVAAAAARIDEAVANDKLSEEKATELKAKLAERIAKLVNEGRPNRGV